MVEIKQIDSYALEWIKLRSLTLAKSINKTTLEALRRELSLGFAEGESIQQLTKRIEGYFIENAKYRAEMVSCSEVIASANEGALHRFELEGVDKSEFLAAPDACEVCLPLDGEIRPTKESHGIIPLHPFCRCVWLPVIE